MLNPVASLLNKRVCKVPVIFVVGQRGELGVPDEPQHVFQGMITQKLLKDMEISVYIIDKETNEKELRGQKTEFEKDLANGNCVALVVKKGALFI